MIHILAQLAELFTQASQNRARLCMCLDVNQSNVGDSYK